MMISHTDLRYGDQIRLREDAELGLQSWLSEPLERHQTASRPAASPRADQHSRLDYDFDRLWEDLEAKPAWANKLSEPLSVKGKASQPTNLFLMGDTDGDWHSSFDLVNRGQYGAMDRAIANLRAAMDALRSAMHRHYAVMQVAESLRDIIECVATQSDRILVPGNDPGELLNKIGRLLTTTETSVKDAAIAEIMQEPMMTEEEANATLAVDPESRESVEEYRKQSWLLGLPTSEGHRYPLFQFDEQHGDIYPVVREVNERLGAVDDPWGVASWWLSPHVRLRGRPADLVRFRSTTEEPGDSSETTDADIVAASKALLTPVG